MQIANFSALRQRLLELHGPGSEELAPFLSDRPMVKGTVYTLRRKCSKPSCRCTTGQKHETTVLTARINGKMRLWQVPEDRFEELQDPTASLYGCGPKLNCNYNQFFSNRKSHLYH